MNESNTYQAVRIGDIADWRLICVISARGMGAWLKHANPTQEIVTLFDEKWTCHSDTLLERIENTVYDHPQVLDDFSADIAIVAPKSIWVPTAMVADDEEEAARLYNQIYTAEECDIMSEAVEDATSLFTLVPGLNAFLQRTFPGARLHSHLAVMARRFRERRTPYLHRYPRGGSRFSCFRPQKPYNGRDSYLARPVGSAISSVQHNECVWTRSDAGAGLLIRTEGS